jgi:hypothetical protein
MVAERRLRSGTARVGLVTSWRNSVEIDSSRVSMRSSMEQAKYPYRSNGWLYEYVSRKSCVPITYTRGDGSTGRAAGRREECSTARCDYTCQQKILLQ